MNTQQAAHYKMLAEAHQDTPGDLAAAYRVIGELLKENDAQAQTINDIWAGKHGCIPHPAEYYKAGIWLIKRIDEHQGHMEWLMSEDELQALKSNQLPF